jgi:hypothetical protein
MKTDLLQILDGILTTISPQQVVPADVAPPGGLIVLSLGVIIALCLLVSFIVLISVLAIRAIKKKNNPKDGV